MGNWAQVFARTSVSSCNLNLVNVLLFVFFYWFIFNSFNTETGEVGAGGKSKGAEVAYDSQPTSQQLSKKKQTNVAEEPSISRNSFIWTGKLKCISSSADFAFNLFFLIADFRNRGWDPM